jgi:hypothetical protein
VSTVIGKSGAWSAIQSRLADRGLTVSQPREIGSLLNGLELDRPQLIAAHRQRTEQEVQTRATEVVRLAEERGFFRRFINRFRIRRLRSQVDRLWRQDAGYRSVLDANVAMLRELRGSAELRGAEAELTVIEELRSLPSHAVVFNDVRLIADRHIHFDGASLQSAQIDHAVLMPTGVFIIETKCWSRKSAESGGFHDPFDQVRRANYMCYDTLRRTIGKTSVRSIIVSFGHLPDPPPSSFVKVVRPDRLVGYLCGFGDAGMSSDKISAIRSFLEARTASSGN